jgi:hypothetical protein
VIFHNSRHHKCPLHKKSYVLDQWIDYPGGKVCSHCGSLHPEQMELILRQACCLQSLVVIVPSIDIFNIYRHNGLAEIFVLAHLRKCDKHLIKLARKAASSSARKNPKLVASHFPNNGVPAWKVPQRSTEH